MSSAFVTLNFTALPKDLESFMADASALCPDLVAARWGRGATRP